MQSTSRLLASAAAALALAAAVPAHAATAASAPAAAAPASAPKPVAIDAEKQKLIDRVLALYHPENAIVFMAQRFATETMEKANIALQGRVTKEKQEATMKDIATDAQAYVNAVTPVVVASAKKNVGPAASQVLAQNFSNEELRQIITMLESPVRGKFEKTAPLMERAVGEKVQAEVGPEVNKDLQTMSQAVGTKLRAAATPTGAK